MAFTARSLLQDVLADPRARAIIEKHVPGATTHPMVYQAMYMSLGEAASYPEAGITPSQFAAIVAELEDLDKE